MEDRELLKKLNNLKDIKPDNNWQKEYREILFSQISAGRSGHETKSNLKIVWESIRPRQILMNFAKPVWLASLASVLILVVGIGGVYASKNSKPGDSLYIAKIISEQAHIAMTFDEKDKAKLGVEFATNRAKEMIQVLQDTGQTATANNEKLEKLSQNFKREISQVKNRLSIIKAAKDQTKAEEADLEVFGANLGKNNQRMEIAEPAEPTSDKSIIVKPTDNTAEASTSKPILESQTMPIATSTDQMLEQAEKLVEEKNIDKIGGAIDKLEEVNKVINQSGSGQVKGESETASSTK